MGKLRMFDTAFAGTTLVIAPPGNPVISLDARLLDRIELIGRSPTGTVTLATSVTQFASVAASPPAMVPIRKTP